MFILAHKMGASCVSWLVEACSGGTHAEEPSHGDPASKRKLDQTQLKSSVFSRELPSERKALMTRKPLTRPILQMLN